MRRKRIANSLLIIVISLTASITCLEMAYRFQWFDFYKAEVRSLNTKDELNSSKPRVLICGDSFSADPVSYVKYLKDSLKDHSVINAAVPGTGIVQQSLYMPHRIRNFKPDVFIYQFYVGNDLFDISHPVGSSAISFTRKSYWWLADRLLSIAYLNFRMAGVRYQYYDDAGGGDKPKARDNFSVNSYSRRERFNNKAEPYLVENTLYLKNGRDKDWQYFEKKFLKMIDGLGDDCKKFFVLIPHESQLSDSTQEKHTLLGAQFSTIPSVSEMSPLYTNIKELCNKNGFILIDPLNSFRNNDSSFYYANDPHLNTAGQRMIATLILEQFGIQKIKK